MRLSLSKLLFLSVCLFLSGHALAAEIIRPVGEATFSAQYEGATNYQWEFPDGVSRTGPAVTVPFEEPGEYDMTLTVEDNGYVSSTTKPVYVYEPGKPTVYPQILINGKRARGTSFILSPLDTLTLDSYALGPDGSEVSVRTSWQYKNKRLSPDEIPHLMREVGMHRVILRGEDVLDKINAHELSLTFFVENESPRIDRLTFREDPILGKSSVILSAEGATDPDGQIIEYRFEVLEKNEVVDVQIVRQPQANFNFKHYEGEHRFSFRVKATDNAGATVSRRSAEEFSVKGVSENRAPRVDISASPGTIAHVGKEILFQAQGFDPDGDHLIYQWFIEDGVESTFPQGNVVRHTFRHVGRHLVRIQVSDEYLQDTKELFVFVFPWERSLPQDQQDAYQVMSQSTSMVPALAVALEESPEEDREEEVDTLPSEPPLPEEGPLETEENPVSVSRPVSSQKPSLPSTSKNGFSRPGFSALSYEQAQKNLGALIAQMRNKKSLGDRQVLLQEIQQLREEITRLQKQASGKQ